MMQQDRKTNCFTNFMNFLFKMILFLNPVTNFLYLLETSWNSHIILKMFEENNAFSSVIDKNILTMRRLGVVLTLIDFYSAVSVSSSSPAAPGLCIISSHVCKQSPLSQALCSALRGLWETQRNISSVPALFCFHPAPSPFMAGHQAAGQRRRLCLLLWPSIGISSWRGKTIPTPAGTHERGKVLMVRRRGTGWVSCPNRSLRPS